jgi:hypothetical protein
MTIAATVHYFLWKAFEEKAGYITIEWMCRMQEWVKMIGIFCLVA